MMSRFDQYFPAHRLHHIGRPESSSPATGSHKQHLAEQEKILDTVIGPGKGA
jgi:2-oxoglutarate dehydrogenase complex dehydrogenase (E1) component-like enzyme